MTDLEAFERVKKLREQYTALEKEIAAFLEAVYPYEAGDLVQHAQLMPLLLELEEQLTAEIWQQKCSKMPWRLTMQSGWRWNFWQNSRRKEQFSPLRWQKNYRRITSSS